MKSILLTCHHQTIYFTGFKTSKIWFYLAFKTNAGLFCIDNCYFLYIDGLNNLFDWSFDWFWTSCILETWEFEGNFWAKIQIRYKL